MREFADKVAVVTGGASGIGFALAERFGQAGMRIVLADIEEPALQEATSILEAAGVKVLGVHTDVADFDSVVSLREQALDAFGSVHIICNNAGVIGRTILETSIEQWRWVLGVNLFGVINGCAVFVPTLIKQNEGHVVNTASLAGLRGNGILGVYNTTKFGVVGLSESLHEELTLAGSSVGVSILCPGFVNTKITQSERNLPPSLRAGLRSTADSFADAVQTGMDPAEVARAVFDAVESMSLYVLTDPERARGLMEERMPLMFGQQ